MLYDRDKLRDSPFDAVMVGRIVIRSRYEKAAEFDLMARAIGGLSFEAREPILDIWCDSKATHSYVLNVVQSCEHEKATQVAEELSKAFCREVGGHNGIHVASHNVCVEPEWEDEE